MEPKSLRFNPAVVGDVITLPIKHFFEENGKDYGLHFSEDDASTQIRITTVNDINRRTRSFYPAIYVDRGGYGVRSLSISDSMSEQLPFPKTGGITDRINSQLIEGTATINLIAAQEGTLELMIDIVSHILTWSSPVICDVLGFKRFGIPMQVSSVAIQEHADNGTAVFRAQIQFPYSKEEHWKSYNDGVKLKSMLQNLIPA